MQASPEAKFWRPQRRCLTRVYVDTLHKRVDPGGREVVPFLTKKSSVEFLVGSGSL
jgi:hypothetical protein